MQFDQQTKDTPDYLFFNIRGSASTSTNPEGYLIFYGVEKWVDSVPPQIYHHALETSMFEYDGGKMKMNMDLDMNGNSLVGVNSSFFIPGWYDPAKDKELIFLNPVSGFQIIPFDCVLKKIVCYFIPRGILAGNFAINVAVLPALFGQTFRFRPTSTHVEIETNLSINKNTWIKIRFPLNVNPNLSMIDKAVFAFHFAPR